MKKIFKFILYILFFLISLTILLPKENIYYFVNKKLNEQKIVLNQSGINDEKVSLNIKDITVMYDNIEVSNIDTIKLDTFLLFNSLNIKGINIDSSMTRYVPKKIDNISARYSVLNPLKVIFKGSFELGVCNGYVDLLNRIIKIDIEVSQSFSKKYKHMVKYLKKEKIQKDSKLARYSYEYQY
ncbi:MAG: hypothetical protein U9Q33_03200 [Campylobacterota bacterium]|nr:hypothetical protein [Campylobacterota bacterium]